MTAVADRATAHFITCAHCVYPRGLLVDYAKLKRIPGKSQNALCVSKNILRFEYSILNSSEILPIGFTFDKKEAFTADQPTPIHTCLISIKWLVSDNMDHISSIEEGSKTPYTRAINVLVKLRNSPFEYLSRHSNFGKILFSLLLFVLYNAYLIGCIVRKAQYIY